MQLSKTVFRFLLVIVSFLAILTFLLFLLQTPGSDGYVISVVTLVIQVAFLIVLALALYLDLDPLAALEEQS